MHKKSTSPTLSFSASEKIKEDILNGVYKPGQLLREEDLSNSLEIGRTAVREALLIVSRTGLIQLRPRRGAIVVNLSVKLVDEIFTLRASLESYAVKLSILKGGMNAERISIVRQAYENIVKLSTAGLKRALVDADMRFHWAICEPCGHELLLRTLGELQTQTRLCIFYTKLFNSDNDTDAQTHLPILRAVEDLNADRAARAVSDHILNANNRLLINMAQSLNPEFSGASQTPESQRSKTVSIASRAGS